MGPSPSDPHAVDPFRHVDLASATRIGAAMGLVGVVAALVTLPFSPPHGAVAVASVAVFPAACAAAALHLWRRPEPASPRGARRAAARPSSPCCCGAACR